MDSGYYAACTALMARAQALDTIASNLANTSTVGYRAQHNVFQSVMAKAEGAPTSQLNDAVNNYGVLSGTRIEPTQGTLERTGNEYDLAIEGPGYFVVQTSAGNVYTRSGNFHVSINNQLVTAAGDPVMGENGPVAVLGSPLSISSDGTISTGGALAGKLKIAEFLPGTAMQNLGQTYFSAPAASAKEAKDSDIRQGMLEGSNVNPVASAVELITLQRYAELMQRALTMFHTDMNQIAAQDLPRITPGT